MTEGGGWGPRQLVILLEAACCCWTLGGGNLGTWHRVTSSHGRRTRHIYSAIRPKFCSLAFHSFHFHYHSIRLLLSIYCIVSRIRLDPSQMSVWRPCITATHITSSSSCQQFYHNLQQQQQPDAAGIKTSKSKLLSNCQLYCQLCIQFLSFP